MRELLAYSYRSIADEKLILRIKADNSGNIYVPTAGYSSEGQQQCDYDWMVSIDGGDAVEYNGVGSNGGSIRVGYGLTPLSVHTVTIRPKIEKYGWLRAFAYCGGSYATSLINIISDKSYKGYAVSDIFTGDYYKAYQYQGCTNLINTDEELLPDTLYIIGNYYRYYEYAGCTSLVSNAEEKILKTVRVIGDNYRAYQYKDCTSINTISMRAINRASVGSNYRLGQYYNIANDRNPANIYIEGGIEEGGNWNLTDSNINGIYVYKDLVSDYQTKLSGITSSKIKKNPIWDNNEYEFIEFIALADSNGEIRIPIGGFSTTMSQDCAYDWMISLDGGEAVEYSGTGDDSYFTIGSDLVEGSEHRVIIKPKTVGWGWGRAFGYLGTGAQAYIKELIHDSYKCYATSRGQTGAHYKHATFAGCINLINSYEKLPTSVTTISGYYMKECYAGCTGLKTAFWEVLHKDCTVAVDYRYHEYTGCTGLEIYQGIAGYMKGTHPTNYKYEYLAGAGNNMDVYITRYEGLPSNVVASLETLGYIDSYTLATIDKAGEYEFDCNVYEGGSSGGTTGYVYKNGVLLGQAHAGEAGVTNPISVTFSAQVGDVITMKVQISSYGYGNCNNIKLSYITNPSGLDNNRINKVYCYVDDIYNYKHNTNWYNITKFGAWYYGYICNDFVDINRYTKLLGSISMPSFERGQLRYYDRGIGLERKKDWSKMVIGATNSGKDSTGGGYVGYVVASLHTTKQGDYNVVDSVSITGGQLVGGSTWSGSNICYCNALNYDIKGNIYCNFAFNGSNRDSFGLYPIWQIPGHGDKTLASAISRNGKYLWGVRYNNGNSGFGLFHTNSAFDFSNYTLDIVDTQYGNLMFSDDGMTMVSGNSDWTLLTQYSLTTPRDISTATTTGKTLSITGQVSLSSDCKYLFRFDDTTNTLYQYTYE